MQVVCARHGTERARCKASCQVVAEPKARRRAQASTVRWGLEEAQSTRAGRRTGTGEEVWCTRDERARAREGLPPPGVSCIHPVSTRGTCWVLPWEIGWWSRSTGLRAERSALSGQQKSAEGIVDPTQARLVRHPTVDRRGHREAKPPRGWAEGPNGVPRGVARKGAGVSCRAGARHP